jgi:hypothetical protein
LFHYLLELQPRFHGEYMVSLRNGAQVTLTRVIGNNSGSWACRRRA